MGALTPRQASLCNFNSRSSGAAEEWYKQLKRTNGTGGYHLVQRGKVWLRSRRPDLSPPSRQSGWAPGLWARPTRPYPRRSWRRRRRCPPPASPPRPGRAPASRPAVGKAAVICCGSLVALGGSGLSAGWCSVQRAACSVQRGGAACSVQRDEGVWPRRLSRVALSTCCACLAEHVVDALGPPSLPREWVTVRVRVSSTAAPACRSGEGCSLEVRAAPWRRC